MKKSVIGLIAGISLGVIALFFDSKIVEFFYSNQYFFLSSILKIFEPMIFVLFFMLLMAMIAFFTKKNWKIILASPIIAGIFAHVIKLIITRPRPLGLVEYLPIPLINIIDFSFPSAHAATMFALLPVLNKEYANLKWLWWTLVLVVTITRLYFNQHYLSDVIFGSVLGYFIGDFIASKNR
ncbi:MAG: phosphatase PAP2 family protein [archaeon]|nr:phosphatase PAP2 family protein [archaeon]